MQRVERSRPAKDAVPGGAKLRSLGASPGSSAAVPLQHIGRSLGFVPTTGASPPEHRGRRPAPLRPGARNALSEWDNARKFTRSPSLDSRAVHPLEEELAELRVENEVKDHLLTAADNVIAELQSGTTFLRSMVKKLVAEVGVLLGDAEAEGQNVGDGQDSQPKNEANGDAEESGDSNDDEVAVKSVMDRLFFTMTVPSAVTDAKASSEPHTPGDSTSAIGEAPLTARDLHPSPSSVGEKLDLGTERGQSDMEAPTSSQLESNSENLFDESLPKNLVEASIDISLAVDGGAANTTVLNALDSLFLDDGVAADTALVADVSDDDRGVVDPAVAANALVADVLDEDRGVVDPSPPEIIVPSFDLLSVPDIPLIDDLPDVPDFEPSSRETSPAKSRLLSYVDISSSSSAHPSPTPSPTKSSPGKRSGRSSTIVGKIVNRRRKTMLTAQVPDPSMHDA